MFRKGGITDSPVKTGLITKNFKLKGIDRGS